MPHIFRAKRTHDVPDRRTQQYARELLQANCRLSVSQLAWYTGINVDICKLMVKHFRSQSAGDVSTFVWYGERKHKPMLCVECGATVRATINGSCRRCFMGITPIDHATAHERNQTDKAKVQSRDDAARYEALREVEVEQYHGVSTCEADHAITPEVMEQLAQEVIGCFMCHANAVNEAIIKSRPKRQRGDMRTFGVGGNW